MTSVGGCETQRNAPRRLTKGEPLNGLTDCHQGFYARRMATFALVHGAWHGAWCWELLTPELTRRGHRVVAPDLPAAEPSATLQTYADIVCTALDGLGGDDVVVVGLPGRQHDSTGGRPVARSSTGLPVCVDSFSRTQPH